MVTITLTAGVFLRRTIRNELNRLKFNGRINDFIETKGFLESVFDIKCSIEVAYSIKKWVNCFSKEAS